MKFARRRWRGLVSTVIHVSPPTPLSYRYYYYTLRMLRPAYGSGRAYAVTSCRYVASLSGRVSLCKGDGQGRSSRGLDGQRSTHSGHLAVPLYTVHRATNGIRDRDGRRVPVGSDWCHALLKTISHPWSRTVVKHYAKDSIESSVSWGISILWWLTAPCPCPHVFRSACGFTVNCYMIRYTYFFSI